MRIKLIQGDITKQRVDAVVNPANTKGHMGGGVAGALRRAVADVVHRQAMRLATGKVGTAWLTPVENAPFKAIIHAATMAMDFKTNEKAIASATRSAMAIAKEHGFKSVCFPAMGTGVGGFDPGEAARIMYREIAAFADDPEAPQDITIVLYDARTASAFKSALAGRELVDAD